MRLQRTADDFRVVEQLNESFLIPDGDYQVVRATWKHLTSDQVAKKIASAAKVPGDRVVRAGNKDRGGISTQYFTVEGGDPVVLESDEIRGRVIGLTDRHITSEDVPADAFEIIVRDLSGDDMRRLRHNMAQLRDDGMPNYFDDPRFGCLRHGQGFVMRDLLKGRFEDAIKSMLCAPSPYGSDAVEQFKFGIRRRWGNWPELVRYCRDRRGMSLFRHLVENPGDFAGALRVGFATRERNIHLFAFQSHLWNRAVAMLVRRRTEVENRGWLPGDAGTLPVYRELPELQPGQRGREALGAETLPLPGAGPLFDETVRRIYQPVFEAERIDLDAFLNFDVPGFRPLAEDRILLMRPEFLRAAPAERDELYPRARRMRVRFTLPRGHYPTLVMKRLLMPTEAGDKRHVMWISRHPLVWPDDDGRPRVFESKPRREDDRDDRQVRRGPRPPQRGGFGGPRKPFRSGPPRGRRP